MDDHERLMRRHKRYENIANLMLMCDGMLKWKRGKNGK